MPNNEIELNVSGGGGEIALQLEGTGGADGPLVRQAEAWARGEREGVPVGENDPAWHNNAKYYAEEAAQRVEDAQEEVENAQEEVKRAEAWARGTRGGEAVGSTDETWHNNAKYYRELAQGDANAAAGSATAAGQAAGQAAGYASAAETAQQAAEAAAQEAGQAAGYASAAETAQQAAEAAAQEAAETVAAAQGPGILYVDSEGIPYVIE